jgi:hypothetical protein
LLRWKVPVVDAAVQPVLIARGFESAYLDTSVDALEGMSDRCGHITHAPYPDRAL